MAGGELAHTTEDVDVPFDAVAVGTNTVDTALHGGSPAAAFTGGLADIQLFDRALSGEELAAGGG